MVDGNVPFRVELVLDAVPFRGQNLRVRDLEHAVLPSEQSVDVHDELLHAFPVRPAPVEFRPVVLDQGVREQFRARGAVLIDEQGNLFDFLFRKRRIPSLDVSLLHVQFVIPFGVDGRAFGKEQTGRIISVGGVASPVVA